MKINIINRLWLDPAKRINDFLIPFIINLITKIKVEIWDLGDLTKLSQAKQAHEKFPSAIGRRGAEK